MGVRPFHAGATALTLTGLLAGCAGGGGTHASSAAPQSLTSRKTATPATPATSATSPSAAPAVPTGASSAPRPASASTASRPASASSAPKDGTNLAACHEGTCEVRVRAGDQIELSERFEAGPLVITDVAPGRLSLRWTFEGGGMGAGDAGPEGTITFGNGGTTLTVRIESISADSATIRLTPGSADNTIIRLTPGGSDSTIIQFPPGWPFVPRPRNGVSLPGISAVRSGR